jgi:hypothetical protein
VAVEALIGKRPSRFNRKVKRGQENERLWRKDVVATEQREDCLVLARVTFS